MEKEKKEYFIIVKDIDVKLEGLKENLLQDL